jgi:hypothetical protein
MATQAQSKVIPQARFRRAPSRCQFFWQGILILATLALAVAANAQSACYDVFASRNAPLRKGDSVTIRYSFADAKPTLLSDGTVRRELLSSTERDSHRLQEEARVIREQIQALKPKDKSNKAVAVRAELQGQITKIETEQLRVKRLQQLAQNGGRLTPDEFNLLAQHTFEQKIILNGKADKDLLENRLNDLRRYLATVDKVTLPRGKIKRVISFTIRHKIVTVILVAAAAGLAGGAYNLYLSQQQDAEQGTVTQLYDEGPGNAPLVQAHDDPKEAIGN